MYPYSWTPVVGIIIGFVLLVVAGIIMYWFTMLDNALMLMMARALVGRQISDNPVSEGVALLKAFGNRLPTI